MTRFGEVKATFWGEGWYGVQPPLTDAVVQDAGRQLGIRLPASLLEMLRTQNGGFVAKLWNAFPAEVPTSWSRNHVPLDDMMRHRPSRQPVVLAGHCVSGRGAGPSVSSGSVVR
ncbi:hypothetical protein ABTX34_34260 [Streptomyces sp. NPDC096538]|uniref:hypothetical protein n=1 Tax=Streptomyces sp. NPDC096538 TaxID=3155427 RepID=UPI003332DD1D